MPEMLIARSLLVGCRYRISAAVVSLPQARQATVFRLVLPMQTAEEVQ
jgi:hypothetical protein